MKINQIAVVIISLYLLLTSLPLLAQQQKAAGDSGSAVQANPPGSRLALHFRAGEATPEIAAGLELTVLDAIENNGDLSVASMARMIRACRQANIDCGPTKGIRIQDIPYLSLRADARNLITGQVDFIDGLLRVDLLAFEGASGKSISSAIVEGHLHSLDKLVVDLTSEIGRLCDVKLKAEAKIRSDAARFNALKHLGKAWIAFYAGKNVEALQELLYARSDGIEVTYFYSNEMVEILETFVVEEQNPDPELRARYYDLKGEIVKAVAEYEKIIERKPRGVDAYLNIARMYLRAGKSAELQAVLQKLDKISLEPESVYIKGLMQLRQSKSEYLDTWKYLSGKKVKYPEVFMALASSKNEKKNQAALYAMTAADLYSKWYETPSANEAYLESFELNPSTESMVNIKYEQLSAAQKERIKKALNEAGEKAGGIPAFMIAQARMLAETEDIDKTVETYLAADKLVKDSVKLKSEIAGYYLRTNLDAYHALSHLTGESRFLPDDTEMLKRLALLFQKAEMLDKAEECYQKRINIRPDSFSFKLDLIDFYEKSSQSEKAQAILTHMLEQNPENQILFRRLARFSLDNNKPELLETALQNLALVDVRSHDAFVAEINDREKKKKNEKASARAETKRDVVLTFRELADLEKLIPVKPGKSVIIDATGYHKSAVDWIVDLFFSTSTFNSQPIAADLEKIISAKTQLVPSSEFADRLDLSHGIENLNADSFKAFFVNTDVTDVYLFSVQTIPQPEKDMDDYRVNLYQFRKGGKGLAVRSATIEYHQEFLLGFNFFVLITPFLALLLVVLVLLRAKLVGKGNLLVKVSFDEHYQRGLFGVRLSAKKLESAFDLDNIMQSHRSDLERMMNMEELARKSFKSVSRYVQQVSEGRAVFKNIPAGAYNVYLAGIMVNAKDGMLLGTYELSRHIAIEKDGNHNIEIDLRLTEVYIGIKAVHERIEKFNAVEKQSDGTDKQVVSERIKRDALTGATIEVDGDPAQTKISLSEEYVSYYLPFGTHYFTLSMGNEAAYRKVEINNTDPQEIDIALLPANEALQKAMAEGHVAPERNRAASSQGTTQDSGAKSLRPSVFHGGASLGRSPAGGGGKESRRSSLIIPPDAIELSDDILRVPEEIVLGETSSSNSDGVKDGGNSGFRDIAEILNIDSDNQEVDLFNSEEVLSNEEARKRYIEKGLELMSYKRYVEAAELFLRAGDFGRATEAAQQSGNQNIHYKIYGMNYFNQGQFQEAVEMFKYAEEPLLEADALEGLRLIEEANLKRGEYWRKSGNPTRAIPFFEKAGEFKSAADLYEEMGQFVQAGEAFMKARLYDDAGRNFMKAKKIKRAAEAYERAGQFMKAAELFNMVGGKVKVFSLYEKAGRFCEAAEGYKKFGMLDEAIHACQQVRPDSHEYLKASLIMGRIFTERGEHDLARTVYSRAISNIKEIGAENIEPYYEFGVLIQEQGNIHEARQIFERIQTVKYNFADVSIRLQNLQALIEDDYRRHGTVNPPSTLPSFSGYRTAGSLLSDSQGEPDDVLPPESMATPVPASRYVFIEELGRGAMGIVYKARDSVLDRIVAYKTVSSSVYESPTALKYFISEAKSLAALNHVNIVTIFDVGQDKNGYFITMEYINGRPLSQFIAEKGRLTTKNSVVIASKVCAGLDYAHNNNIIHRDIKPSNVMISEQGEVKIMDFGLARIVDEAVNRKTIAKGTPLYMAPEQVEGVGVDHRADIYSFGVTLFEMTTGTLPFTKGDIAYHHVHTDPPRPSEYNPNIPKVLEKIILRCLEKRKEDRYYSASEIKKELMPLRNALIAGKL